MLGTTPALMANGIPDAAWDPIEGDDKNSNRLKLMNRDEARPGMLDFGSIAADETKAVAQAVADLDAAHDDDAQALAGKERHWTGILSSEVSRHGSFVADAWCAAFVWPKTAGPFFQAAPTNDVWRKLRDTGAASALTTKTAVELAEQSRFFHWHLQFPQVFARGGFNVVLGNPPWERVKLQEQEFFTPRDEEIAKAPNAAARKRLIARLPATHPALWSEWVAREPQGRGRESPDPTLGTLSALRQGRRQHLRHLCRAQPQRAPSPGTRGLHRARRPRD